MRVRRGHLAKLFLFFFLTAGLLYLTAGMWLSVIGRALVYDEGPAMADAAVVLAGDVTGGRATAGAQLADRGYVPVVLLSGPPGYYGINEADAAIRFLAERGYHVDRFVPIRHSAMSTRAEADVLVGELKRRKARSFLLVTSNYHTRRARRLFLEAIQHHGGGLSMRVFATADHDYDPSSWWKSRQGWKMAFFEWTKTVTSMMGI